MNSDKIKAMAKELIQLCEKRMDRATASRMTVLIEDCMFHAEMIHQELGTSVVRNDKPVTKFPITGKTTSGTVVTHVKPVLSTPTASGTGSVATPEKKTRKRAITKAAVEKVVDEVMARHVPTKTQKPVGPRAGIMRQISNTIKTSRKAGDNV